MESKGPPDFFSWLNLDIQISGPRKPFPPGESRCKAQGSRAKNSSEGGSQEKFSGETMGSLGSFWGKFQESAQLQKACQLLNNINDIDNIMICFLTKIL